MLLFSTFSECFASQPTLDEMTKFIDLIKVKQNNGDLVSYTKITGNSSSIATQFLNLTSDINFSLSNVVYLPGQNFISNGSWKTNSFNGVFLIANNTIGDDLPFLYIRYLISSGNPMFYTNDISGNLWSTYYAIKGDNVTSYSNCSNLHCSGGSYDWQPNIDLTVLNNNCIFTKYKTASIYVYYSGTYYPMLNNYFGDDYNTYYNIQPEPEEPSGDIPDNNGLGNITTPSGDNGGNINLQPIQQGLTDIQNQISGDTQKIVNTLTEVPDLSGETISSEQITENIDFALINNNPTLNGYTNFWLTLTNGLSGALTGNVRSIDINFRGQTYTISLDDFSIQLPQQLKFILGMISTIYFVILIVKWWKIIIDKITGGDIDEVLAMNEEERNYRFILGGV